MSTGRGRDPDRRPYSRKRAFFDAVAAVNVMAIVAAEAMAFPEGGLGLKVYGVAVLGIVVALWLVLRRYEYPVWMVVVLQLALLGHFAGRLVAIGGVPLYQANLLGIPMDKVIHAFNSMAGAVFVTGLFRLLGLRLAGWEGFVVVMVVCGCGALIEIIEYGGVLVLPANHVGGYANNMQDLVANLVGAFAGWGLVRLVSGPASEAGAIAG